MSWNYLVPILSQLLDVQACTRVFQQSQQGTENVLKMIPSVLSWAGDVPLAVESNVAWGPEALRTFSQVATRLAIRGNTPKSKVVAELYGRLSLLLVRANARSTLICSYPQTPQQENELFTNVHVVVLCVCVCLCVCCQFAVMYYYYLINKQEYDTQKYDITY